MIHACRPEFVHRCHPQLGGQIHTPVPTLLNVRTVTEGNELAHAFGFMLLLILLSILLLLLLLLRSSSSLPSTHVLVHFPFVLVHDTSLPVGLLLSSS